MVIDMNETKLTTLAQLEAFVAGTAAVVFQAKAGEDNRYRHIGEVLRRFCYPTLKRPDKGIVLRYLRHTTGYSRQQLTRLVKRQQEAGGLEPSAIARPRGDLRAGSARRTWRCWLRRTPCTARFPGRPPATCSNGPRRSTAMPAMPGWRRSRWDTCTTCATPRAMWSAASSGPERGR
jgi:hypothetical protein